MADVVRGTVKADVFGAAGFGEGGFDGVAEQVSFEEAVFVEFGNEPDDFGHVATGDIIGKVGVAENFFDEDKLVLDLGGRVALPDFAGVSEDGGIEREEAGVQGGQDFVVCQDEQR